MDAETREVLKKVAQALEQLSYTVEQLTRNLISAEKRIAVLEQTHGTPRD